MSKSVNPRKQAEIRAQLASALQYHRAGQVNHAEALYVKIIAQDPHNPDALHLLGLVALNRGQADEAIRLIGKALKTTPDFADAHNNLGNALVAAGKFIDAETSYRRAVTLRPDMADAHCNLGHLLCILGSAEGAIVSCERAIHLKPDFVEAHLNLGNALQKAGRTAEAIEAFKRAISLRPKFAAAHRNLGTLQLEIGRFTEAIENLAEATALEPESAVMHQALGAAYRAVGDLRNAETSYRRAVELSPKDSTGWNDLGVALRDLGRFTEAEECFRQAIEIRPDFAEAYRHLAGCKRSSSETEIEDLKRLLARPSLPMPERIAAGFALGKHLDDSESYDEAFEYYANANALQREMLAKQNQLFDAGGLKAHVDKLINTFTPDFFRAHANWGNPTEKPVFVVGMPRSGTSLIEQIAASHSQVFGAGELKDIGRIANVLSRNSSAPLFDGADRWTAAQISELASAHLERLTALGGSAKRTVDKLPDNIFMLGLVATLFPLARIVFCERDPRDTCLSCYFQKFSAGNAFSYDLKDCGIRYMETERLAAYWMHTLPLRMIRMRYEALIAQPEQESRRLIEFLGLEWEPSCLDFYRTERVVTTASSWQVRQPIYQHASGRWQHYRKHLAPLLATLRPIDKPDSVG